MITNMTTKEIISITKLSTSQQTAYFENLLSEVGLINYTISYSSTNFGNSNYFKFFSSDLKNIFTVRLSDHSVGNRRLFDEVSFLSFLLNMNDYLRCYNSYNN